MTTDAQLARETALSDPKAVVEAFLAAFEALDLDGALAFIADDCVYQNVPFHTARGKERIARDLRLLATGMTEFRVEMIHLAVDGNVVLTERVDTLANRVARAAIPVMGTFVVENGKIREWRDYLDWSQCLGRMAKSVVLKPLGMLR